MNRIAAATVLLAVVTGSKAETISFEDASPGHMPPGWTCGVTGQGVPRWVVELETSGPIPSKVLAQRGSADFPWCVVDRAQLENGRIAVKFKPIAGRSDQAGGIVWRFKDGNTYYIARANALENNVSLYYTEKGTRHTLESRSAPVARGAWHALEVRFQGDRVQVLLDGKGYIDRADTHVTGAGKVGVWTKADSVTFFDDFTFDRE